jgi:hypothetical protein
MKKTIQKGRVILLEEHQQTDSNKISVLFAWGINFCCVQLSDFTEIENL